MRDEYYKAYEQKIEEIKQLDVSAEEKRKLAEEAKVDILNKYNSDKLKKKAEEAKQDEDPIDDIITKLEEREQRGEVGIEIEQPTEFINPNELFATMNLGDLLINENLDQLQSDDHLTQDVIVNDDFIDGEHLFAEMFDEFDKEFANIESTKEDESSLQEAIINEPEQTSQETIELSSIEQTIEDMNFDELEKPTEEVHKPSITEDDNIEQVEDSSIDTTNQQTLLNDEDIIESTQIEHVDTNSEGDLVESVEPEQVEELIISSNEQQKPSDETIVEADVNSIEELVEGQLVDDEAALEEIINDNDVSLKENDETYDEKDESQKIGIIEMVLLAVLIILVIIVVYLIIGV